MKVLVKVIGPLIYKTGFSEKDLDLPPRTTVAELVTIIGIPADRPRITTRNGKAVLPEDEIEEGDKIAVSPIYSGG
ncbi:MAG: MoaD/ThiS family protein [Candidatus Aminicenantes bacterium]|nr:MoaD/ThiS family protein [Candidatus Aminicenantes bacterium]